VASRLLQVKMNILPYDTCRRQLATSDADGSHINSTVHLCIGSVPTRDAGICNVFTSVLAVWQ